MPVLDYMKSNSSHVKNVVTYSYDFAIVKDGYDFIKENGAIVSPNFFEMFDMPLKYGEKSRLKDQNTVFITENMSEKYFKDIFPIDQTMTIYIDEQYKAEVVVGGVFEDIPLNSTFQFDILVNQDLYNSLAELDPNNWKKTKRVGMYIDTENPTELIADLEEARLLNNDQSKTWQIAEFDLMPFIDSRVSDHIINYSPGNMRIRPEAVIIFVFMALLILLVACFNFTNTGIALMANRVKEIGIRRTIGSQSRQIFQQFFFEILVISFFALMVAIGMSNFFAEQFFGLYGVKFLLQDISIIRFIPFLILFLLIVTSISGLLPSLYALRFNTVNILQSKYKLKGLGLSHKILTSGQFIFSITALIAGLSFAVNSNYMSRFDFGFNARNLMVFKLNDASEVEKLRFELNKKPFTKNLVSTYNHIDQSSATAALKLDTGEISVRKYSIGSGYFDIMDMEIQEGRDFMESSASDIRSSVIVNESFAKVYLKQDQYLGQQITINDEKKTVVGVVKDVINTVYADYEQLDPELYVAIPDSLKERLIVKVQGDRPEIDDQAKAIWSDLFESPYTARWQEDLTSFYPVRDSKNMKMIFLYLAGLSCFLSIMGIFSLASMNVSRKFKEISIRKVLGASYLQIISSINKTFVYILIISLLIGVVLGSFVSDLMIGTIYRFYEILSYVEAFGIGAIVIVIALIFISTAVLSKSNSNPAAGLRSE